MAMIKENRSFEDVKELAVRMAIMTGYTPEVDFIWAIQESENKTPCFGQVENCAQKRCQWRSGCLSLEKFAESELTASTSM
jgi:hypothetical protein